MSWLVGAVPLVSGLLTNQACPVPKQRRARGQPPDWAFALVWPILYILLGVAWVRSRSRGVGDAWFLLIVGCLMLWQYLYGCAGDRQAALYTLVGSTALVTATAFWISGLDRTSAVLLCPLIAWLILATILNWDLV